MGDWADMADREMNREMGEEFYANKAEEERYANCLAAIFNAACCDVDLKTLETMRFEMNVDRKDYQKIMESALFKILTKGRV